VAESTRVEWGSERTVTTATCPLADGCSAGVLASSERTKVSGIRTLSALAIERVTLIDRIALLVDFARVAASIFAPFWLMAGLAEALQLAGSEGVPRPLMWRDVVGNRCCCGDAAREAFGAKRFDLQLVGAKGSPDREAIPSDPWKRLSRVEVASGHEAEGVPERRRRQGMDACLAAPYYWGYVY
jgi:hypothetical protein